MDESKMWTHEQTARYLGIEEQTLYFLNHQRKGPKYYKVGRYNRYRKADVDHWLETQCLPR
ncbi:AlpA family transcriptional regulator [Micromonospora pisi]|uniref:AlpA family transcriptional regulator n=2 Tax=Micromonospora TaxID=1873 RepID=A0A495JJW0_9ACTN|nr:helix-turn-helix domain-containing protein [Micromonospora pisi]RKR88279.1 AlpA family transcriptional regulator [Micromonospora pisi]